MKHFFHFRTAYQLGFSLLIVLALVIQFAYGITTDPVNCLHFIANFFSYFTILSNIFVAVILSMEASISMRGAQFSPRFTRARAAAVFCILTTGIIYSFFLRGPGGQGQVQDSIPWINAVFHYIMPVAMTLDWTLFPPKTRVPWIWILRWIGLTLIYLIYVELLGLLTKTYPYFFVDPTTLHGYGGVARASLAFVPFFVVFGAATVLLSKVRPAFSWVYRKVRSV
jgi:hypothetical protein